MGQLRLAGSVEIGFMIRASFGRLVLKYLAIFYFLYLGTMEYVMHLQNQL